jgi:sugar lactone lactonase YvrE
MRTRSVISALTLLVVIAILAGPGTAAQSSSQAVTALPAPFHSVENYLKLPDGRKLGAIVGIRFDRDDSSVWLADRCGANTCVGSTFDPVLKFDASGRLVKSFGAGMLVFPHGLFVDKEGNVWVTDTGGQGSDHGHQVFKFNPDGKVLMALGKAGTPGDGPDTFNQPSDLVVATTGDVFIADGHGGNSNHRVVKYRKDGTFVKAWGKKGSQPGEFETPHAMVIDSRDHIYIADRGNKRIQIFDTDGKFIAAWTQFGDPDGLFIVKDGKVTGFIPKNEGMTQGEGVIETVAVNAKGVMYAVAGVSGSRPNIPPLRIFVRK